ncbi:hypothetical protein GQ457_03G020990 [Hibiscus cannabinus]
MVFLVLRRGQTAVDAGQWPPARRNTSGASTMLSSWEGLFPAWEEDVGPPGLNLALIQFWNPGYCCFTLNGKDLMPTVEEYSELLPIPNITEGQIYTKPNKPCNQFKVLSQLVGRSVQRAEGQFSKKRESHCFPWYNTSEITRTYHDPHNKAHILAVAIYGLEDALEDVLRYSMFGSKATSGKLRGKYCHDEVDSTKWVEAFKNLQEQDLVWRVPWLKCKKFLNKCYDHDWLMLLGLCGGIGCAPLLVSRQFGSQQFVPYTAGLRDSKFTFNTNFKKWVTKINKNWKRCYWMKIASGKKGIVTPKYESWYEKELMIPFRFKIKADLLRVELADAQAEKEKMNVKHTRDLFLAKVEVDKHAGEDRQMSRAEQEIEKERKRNHDLMESEKKKKGKQTIEQYQQALKAEKDNAATWKQKSHDSKIRLTESQKAYNALEIQLKQIRAQYIQLEARDKIENIQVLEDIKQGGNDYWFTHLRDAAHRFQEQDKINEKIMNLAQDVAEHVTALAREARILHPHFDSRFTKILHPYFTRSKAKIMNMEEKMTTMETNHHVLQEKLEKLEKDLKEEIAQAQQNIVGQIALMLGLPDSMRGKAVEEGISVGDLPYIPEKTGHHDREQSRMGTSRTRVQFNAGPAASIPTNSGITHNHDPELEIPNFDEVDEKSKAERKLEDRCEKLEELIWSMQSSATLGGIDARELSLVADLVVPPKFKCQKMSLYLDNEKLLIHCFQDSLIGSAARWYTQAFLEQYKHVSDMVPSWTVLQTMEQKTNESFCQYVQRWRDVAAQVHIPLLENEITLLFMNTLKDDFYDRMLDHATKPFADMILTGELIQATIKTPRYIAPIQPPYLPWFNPNVKCDYHAGNPGHHINDCTSFKYVMEQLLEAGTFSFEAPEKNPMPNHKGVNVVTERNDRESKESLSDVTTPLKWVWERQINYVSSTEVKAI